MLLRICRRCVIYAGCLLRASERFTIDNSHRNVTSLGFNKACALFQVDRKFSFVSKTLSNSKSEDSDKRQIDNREEVHPLHDRELQKFLEEMKKDFEDTEVKEPLENRGEGDKRRNKNAGNSGEEDSPKNFNLSSEEFTSLPLSIRERFEQYKDEDSNVIRSAEEIPQQVSSWKQNVIEVEEEQEVYLYQQKSDKIDYISLERGKKGVFDIEQLVSVLKQENMQDIAVIKIPSILHYCDHMALATAKSPRHLQAVAEFIRRLHKKKKYSHEPFLKIEGEDCRDWKAIDMGHIVLHLFLPEARELYDIETLWTIGEKYDPLSNQKADPYEDLLKEHMEFLQNTQPLIDVK